MKDTVNAEIWFPAKRYGWGWGLPVVWQGWAVLLTYFLLLFVGIHEFKNVPHTFAVIYVLMLTTILIFICWYKGESPKWRWGGKEDE